MVIILHGYQGLSRHQLGFEVSAFDNPLLEISDGFVEFVAGPPGFEPSTTGSEDQRPRKTIYWANRYYKDSLHELPLNHASLKYLERFIKERGIASIELVS